MNEPNTTEPDNEPPALVDDLALLDRLLDRSLQRLCGPDIAQLVSTIRDRAATGEPIDDLVRGLSADEEMAVVRGLAATFHLANVAEQVHRADELGALLALTDELRLHRRACRGGRYCAIRRPGVDRCGARHRRCHSRVPRLPPPCYARTSTSTDSTSTTAP